MLTQPTLPYRLTLSAIWQRYGNETSNFATLEAAEKKGNEFVKTSKPENATYTVHFHKLVSDRGKRDSPKNKFPYGVL